MLIFPHITGSKTEQKLMFFIRNTYMEPVTLSANIFIFSSLVCYKKVMTMMLLSS